MTNWHVITGGPSSGKTTMIRLLAQRGYRTTIEHARHFIDTQRVTGKTVAEIRANQREFQRSVLMMQMKQEEALDPDELYFLDRALPDSLAYYRYLGLEPEPELLAALKTTSYRKVFALDLLPLTEDYARTESSVAQRQIHAMLIEVYEGLGYPVERVPVLPVEQRVEFILSRVETQPHLGHVGPDGADRQHSLADMSPSVSPSPSPPSATTIAWLEAGDVSVRYQTRRDLEGHADAALQSRIATEGWGAAILAQRNADQSWGRGFYQPKWTSSHYTLLDLKMLAISPVHPLIRASVRKIVTEEKKADGGIGPGRSISVSDVCVNGMFLNYASYFGASENELESVVDFILAQRMPDGGFNCRLNRSGARHSSMHSTLSVLEGISEYVQNGYNYRITELQHAAEEGREFLLRHRLFKSDRTGLIIRQDFLRLSYPPRWKYNILRALDYFRASGAPWDPRMSDAVAELVSRRRADGRWLLASAHRGETHLTMETAGQPSRWNTLLALRVLKSVTAGPRSLI